jgi:hypothetical protein
MLDDARRRLRRLEKRIAEAREADDENFSRARGLFEDGKRVGLISRDSAADSRDEAFAALRRATGHVDEDDDLSVGDPASELPRLQERRRQLRGLLKSLQDEIRELELLLSGASGFEREAGEQRARLAAIGLIGGEHSTGECPVCQSVLKEAPPTVVELNALLDDVSQQLSSVRQENPRVQEWLATVERQGADADAVLRENQRLILSRIEESERFKRQQDVFVQRARVLGRIGFYLEVASTAAGEDGLNREAEVLRAEVAELERGLDLEAMAERVTTLLNVVGRFMTDYAGRLQIEHGDNPLRFDLKNLTVVADTLEGPIPLTRMGSGENWIGYHVVAHLGLHKLFRNSNRPRPVPGFLMLDQVSQAHYPAEQDKEGALDGLPDEDKAAVHRLFKLLHDFAAELTPNMQVIAIDHVDIIEPWFQSAVVERWRGGLALVPAEWLE